MRARVTRRRSLAAETESGSRLVIKLRLARPLPPEWRARAFSTFCSNSRRHHAMIGLASGYQPASVPQPRFLPCANGFDERSIYVGIADHGDDPIQAGRVVAVDTNSGAIVGSFKFASTGTRGGGIWSAVAGGLDKDTVAIT